MVMPIECSWSDLGCILGGGWGGGYGTNQLPNNINPPFTPYQGGTNPNSNNGSNTAQTILNNIAANLPPKNQQDYIESVQQNNINEPTTINNLINYFRQNPMVTLGIAGLLVALLKK